MLTVFVTTSAFAHYCANPNKKPGAGSLGIFDAATDTFTPLKKLNGNSVFDSNNGGFVTLIWFDGTYYDIFWNTALPEGALASGPDGLNMCDGHGVDFFLACAGLEAFSP
jgi:hypothetical protein